MTKPKYSEYLNASIDKKSKTKKAKSSTKYLNIENEIQMAQIASQ